MDLATWRRSCHGIADRMVAPRPGPLASHRPQAQLVADASPPAIPWACLAHYWSACCFWNPPPLRGSATHRHRSTKTWGRLPARPAPTPTTSIPSARYPVPSPFPVPLSLLLWFLRSSLFWRANNSVDLFVCLFYLRTPPQTHRLIHWSCDMQ